MENINKLTKQIIGLAINVHKTLGPGFGETIYKRILMKELQSCKLKVEVEFPIIIMWKNYLIGRQKVDLLVNNVLIVELKAQTQIEDIHLQQLLSYLKASKKSLGLVLNFGAKTLQVKRVINSVISSAPSAHSAVSAIQKNGSQRTQKEYMKTQKVTNYIEKNV